MRVFGIDFEEAADPLDGMFEYLQTRLEGDTYKGERLQLVYFRWVFFSGLVISFATEFSTMVFRPMLDCFHHSSVEPGIQGSSWHT